MRIHPRITIRTFLKKKALTWPRVTLGETEPNKGDISLFAGQIGERAAILKDYLPKYSIKQLGIELYYLVLFHELHHALDSKSTEKAADRFAWKTFKNFFGRHTVIPMCLWRKLPSS